MNKSEALYKIINASVKCYQDLIGQTLKCLNQFHNEQNILQRHSEYFIIASYYNQFSTDIKMNNIKIKTVLLAPRCILKSMSAFKILWFISTIERFACTLNYF